MSTEEPPREYPKRLVIITMIITELVFWLITVGLITFALGMLTGQLLFLPAILAASILQLFNFARFKAWEYYQKQFSKTN